MADQSQQDALSNALTLAQRQGIVGGDLEQHRRHAELFALIVDDRGEEPVQAVDLGSGGGLPALVLIAHWPRTRWLLVEVREKRASFLARAVRMLDAHDRVTIWNGDAQDASQSSDWRGRTDLVTARAFGLPSLVAECGQPFLRSGGAILVSDPPEIDDTRWPEDALATLDLAVEGLVRENARFTVLTRGTQPDTGTAPRSRKAMESSPLF